jgi:hypothetical protein
MAIPKEYVWIAVRSCVWGNPYFPVLLFQKNKTKENSHYILAYTIFIKKNKFPTSVRATKQYIMYSQRFTVSDIPCPSTNLVIKQRFHNENKVILFPETTCYVHIYLTLHYFLTFDTLLSHRSTVKSHQRCVSHRFRNTDSTTWSQGTIRYRHLTIKPPSESSTRKLIGTYTHI